MISSVLVTGDAGGLNYIDEIVTETPRSAFNFCCTCNVPEANQKETNLAP